MEMGRGGRGSLRRKKTRQELGVVRQPLLGDRREPLRRRQADSVRRRV